MHRDGEIEEAAVLGWRTNTCMEAEVRSRMQAAALRADEPGAVQSKDVGAAPRDSGDPERARDEEGEQEKAHKKNRKKEKKRKKKKKRDAMLAKP